MQKIEDKEKPLWLKTDYAEIEALTIKLAKQGLSSEKIGIILRDSYGIPKVKIFSSKISRIIKKAGITQEPQDLSNLKRKVDKLKKHAEINRQDKVAKRSFQITQEKINKLLKRYNIGILK